MAAEPMHSQQSTQGRAARDRGVNAALFGSLGLLLLGLAFWRERDLSLSREHRRALDLAQVSWDQAQVETTMAVLASLAALGLCAYAVVRAGRFRESAVLRRTADAVLVALVLSSGFCWLYAARGVAQGTYVKTHDAFHYLLGPKYFDEFGYFDFYDCIAEVDHETARVLEGHSLRDLRTYGYLDAGKARKRSACRERFSPARWDELRHDYAFFADLSGTAVRQFVRDRGYNGAPFNAFVASRLANAFDITYANVLWASLLDPLGVLVGLYVLGLAFGWRWTSLVAVLFFTLFTDRGYFILGSFFRYHWWITSAFAVAALKRERYARAGAWVAAAGMLNVFPVVFFLGVGLKILAGLVIDRRVERRHARFVIGAVACTLVLGALSVTHAQGLANYSTFLDKMDGHSGLMTHSRVGMRYVFAYRGEVSDADYNASYTTTVFRGARPFYYAALALLGLALAAFVRKLDDVEATVLCGFAAFFYAFSTVEYYYGIHALLLLFWHRRGRDPGALALLAMPFMGSALAGFALQHGVALGVCNNAITSFAILGTLLAYQWAASRQPETTRVLELARRGSRAALVAVGAGVVALTWLQWPARSLARVQGPTLVFGGDVNLGRRQHTHVRARGAAHALAGVEELRTADLAIANLECVVATVGEPGAEKGDGASYYYRARPEMLEVLSAAGIDAVSTANNHSLDYGSEALTEERSLLDRMQLAHFGSGDNRQRACAPVYRQVGDVSVALFGIDATQASFGATVDGPGTCYFDLRKQNAAVVELAPLFQAARRRAQLVLVAVHWGPNRKTKPSSKQAAFGRAVIDAGADAVLGSSAHMVLGVDVHKGRPIVHGAGNLLFESRDDEEGALFSLVLDAGGVRQVWATPLERHEGWTRTATGKRAADLLAKLRQRSLSLGTEVVIEGERAGIDLPVQAARSAPSAALPPNPKLGAPPPARTTPPAECVVDSVPEDARVQPVAIGALTLLGARVRSDVLTARSSAWVETYWTAQAPIAESHHIVVNGRHAGDARARWHGEGEPCDWQWPTARWQPGAIYRDVLAVRPPEVMKSATVRLTVGVRSERGVLVEGSEIGSFEVRLLE